MSVMRSGISLRPPPDAVCDAAPVRHTAVGAAPLALGTRVLRQPQFLAAWLCGRYAERSLRECAPRTPSSCTNQPPAGKGYGVASTTRCRARYRGEEAMAALAQPACHGSLSVTQTHGRTRWASPPWVRATLVPSAARQHGLRRHGTTTVDHRPTLRHGAHALPPRGSSDAA
jgi:hypothetical protein